MENLNETIFGVIIILIVFIWTVNNIIIYSNISEEKELESLLNNYAKIICQQIIYNKEFRNPSEDPQNYGIKENIKIYIQVKEIEYTNEGIKENILFESSKKPLINKGEYVGAYIDKTLIIVRVVVYV
jgi:hypothetical protein